VLTVSKGLVVYLLGDVGTIADQEMVARRFYKPKPAVLNIGGMFSTGPAEAAYVINDLIKPNAVIASHASQATTKNGKLLVGSRVMVFRTAVKVPTYLPVSSKSMSITADGKCVAGC
jgi:L-ascorbate metabolism protein UlaG (beta-lactamase superfamily)